MDTDTIFYGVLGFVWLEFVWESYLSHRQRKIYRKHLTLPKDLDGILDEETFTKARLYALDKSNFSAAQGLFSQIVSTLIIWKHGFKFAWDLSSYCNQQLGLDDSEMYCSLMFTLVMNVFSTLIGLPFSVYNTFVLEEKHGFNQQSAGFYIKDQVKKFILTNVIALPVVAAIIKIIYWGGDFFFIYLWAFVLGFTLFMMIIYPDFIAPLFDKYTPLPEGELRSEIEQLAASIHFPLYKLFVVEGSKRSSHSNAYFYGFFKFKRIVLFDTLLEERERDKLRSEEERRAAETSAQADSQLKGKMARGCSTPEILAVLGHELGHWKMNHVLKNIIISEIHIFMMFMLFAYLYKLHTLYAAFGFVDAQPVLIGLMIILQFITAPFNALLEFGMTALSRRFEFQADEFACKTLKRGQALRRALSKLNNDNLSFPIYDWLYSAWHHSHPPLLQRLMAIRRHEKED